GLAVFRRPLRLQRLRHVEHQDVRRMVREDCGPVAGLDGALPAADDVFDLLRVHRDQPCLSSHLPSWSMIHSVPSRRWSTVSSPSRNAPCSVRTSLVPVASGVSSFVATDTEIRSPSMYIS